MDSSMEIEFFIPIDRPNIKTLHSKTALSISLIANATSYGIGLILFYFRLL